MYYNPFMDNNMNGDTPQGFEYITEVTFSISKTGIKECYQELETRGFNLVNGDIRVGGRKKYVALGYKKEIQSPITNIIGIVSYKQKKGDLIVGSTNYTMIKDQNFNGDINKGSGGSYLYLYYTTDTNAGKPIKDLTFGSYSEQLSNQKDVVQNAPESAKSGNLDINSFRGNRYNYIFMKR